MKRMIRRSCDLAAIFLFLAFAVPIPASSFGREQGNAGEEAALGPIRVHLEGVVRDGNGRVARLYFKDSKTATNKEIESLRRFAHLRAITLPKCDCTEDAIAHLKDLAELEDLHLEMAGAGQLTDAVLLQVSQLKSLRRLVYCGRNVTDTGLQHLGKLRLLETLSLECDKASDRGLAFLANLRQLESLMLLNGPEMTGEGLAAISMPSRLKTLAVHDLADAGLKTATRFSKLRELRIGGDRLTGSALRHLREMKSLEVLVVSAKGVSDGDVQSLAELSSLRVLDLEGTAITNASLCHLLRLRGLEELSVPFSTLPSADLRKNILDGLPRIRRFKSKDADIQLSSSTKQ